MRRKLLRRTLIGAGTGAGAFLLLGIYLNVATGAGLLANPGPMAVLVVIGGTVGGLVGPLFGTLADRDREEESE